MKHRSPIEMMIDQACGYDPAGEAKAKPPTFEGSEVDSKALLRVADAAVAWYEARMAATLTDAIVKELDEAAADLVARGW